MTLTMTRPMWIFKDSPRLPEVAQLPADIFTLFPLVFNHLSDPSKFSDKLTRICFPGVTTHFFPGFRMASAEGASSFREANAPCARTYCLPVARAFIYIVGSTFIINIFFSLRFTAALPQAKLLIFNNLISCFNHRILSDFNLTDCFFMNIVALQEVPLQLCPAGCCQP